MSQAEAINYLKKRLGQVEFFTEQGIPRVTVRLAGSIPFERYSLEEAVAAAKAHDDRVLID